MVLVLNSYRLHQMLQLVRDVKKSVNSDLSMEWLKPFMTERKCAAGEVLFYKDEKAEDMLYIVSGRFRLVESGIELPVGAIVGELGMLSPSNVRTQTLECIEAGLILSVSYTKVEELYVQNPAFGFYFLRLASARLFQNIETLEQRLAQQPHRRPRRAEARLSAVEARVAGVLVLAALSVRRFHRRGRRRAAVPARWLARGASRPSSARPSTADRLPGPGYAQLYVDRLRRFIGRRGVDDAMFGEIARLMAMRMSYEDPIRIAQLKLAEIEAAAGVRGVDRTTSGNSGSTNWSARCRRWSPSRCSTCSNGWDGLHKPVSIRFSTASRWGIRRLKIEAALRRWRLFSVRYAKERVWVERWLHMIDRSLTKQPDGGSAIVQTATMVQGYGDVYRQGLADWHAIIDGLAKPTFDGVLPLTDLAGAVAEARAAAMPDPRQAALKRTIAEIRARVPGKNGAVG